MATGIDIKSGNSPEVIHFLKHSRMDKVKNLRVGDRVLSRAKIREICKSEPDAENPKYHHLSHCNNMGEDIVSGKWEGEWDTAFMRRGDNND